MVQGKRQLFFLVLSIEFLMCGGALIYASSKLLPGVFLWYMARAGAIFAFILVIFAFADWLRKGEWPAQ